MRCGGRHGSKSIIGYAHASIDSIQQVLEANTEHDTHACQRTSRHAALPVLPRREAITDSGRLRSLPQPRLLRSLSKLLYRLAFSHLDQASKYTNSISMKHAKRDRRCKCRQHHLQDAKHAQAVAA